MISSIASATDLNWTLELLEVTDSKLSGLLLTIEHPIFDIQATISEIQILQSLLNSVHEGENSSVDPTNETCRIATFNSCDLFVFLKEAQLHFVLLDRETALHRFRVTVPDSDVISFAHCLAQIIAKASEQI